MAKSTNRKYVPEDVKADIIEMFLTENDNRSIVIAERFNYSIHTVNRIISQYYKLKENTAKK
tara:strand:- start:2289 stop:2474 length:186 start_codon:yes stop_codon:yes gene_type:complete